MIISDLYGAGAPGGLWCLAGFGAGGVVNSTSDLLFTAPPAHEVGLALEFVGSFGVQIFLFFFIFLMLGVSLMEWWFLIMWGAVLRVTVLVSDIYLVLELVELFSFKLTANTQALQ